jgi:hypothetical protein
MRLFGFDLQKGRIALLSSEAIDRMEPCWAALFLKGDTDFAAIWGIPGVELDTAGKLLTGALRLTASPLLAKLGNDVYRH